MELPISFHFSQPCPFRTKKYLAFRYDALAEKCAAPCIDYARPAGAPTAVASSISSAPRNWLM